MRWNGGEFYCPLSIIPFSFSVQAVYLSCPGMKQSNRGTLSAEMIHLPKLIATFCYSRPPNGFTSAHSAKCTHTQTLHLSSLFTYAVDNGKYSTAYNDIYVILYVNLLKSKDKVAQISANLVYCYCGLLP